MKIGDIIQLKRWKEPGANPAYHREVWRVTGFDGDCTAHRVSEQIDATWTAARLWLGY